jgi:hypothetical protein
LEEFRRVLLEFARAFVGTHLDVFALEIHALRVMHFTFAYGTFFAGHGHCSSQLKIAAGGQSVGGLLNDSAATEAISLKSE